MTAVLVTGGAGFIGSHVVDSLVQSGFDVDVLDDLTGGRRQNVSPHARFVEGSIVDRSVVDALFRGREYRYVFHLAAYAAEGLSHFIRKFNYENNLIGSMNLINASIRHEIERFVFTSSIAVYGANQLPMTEELTPKPEDPYGVAKYAVELDLAAAHRMFGLDYTIFRPHNVYGEYQNIGDRYRNVIGIFMNQIMKDQPMTIFGDGSQTRAFSYIADVAPLIASSIENDQAVNEVFNVGADQPYAVKELASVVAAAFDVEPDVIHLPEREEVMHAYASHEKIRDAFELPNPTTLEVGIGRMASWAKSVGPTSSARFSDVEIWKNFPEGWRDLVDPAG